MATVRRSNRSNSAANKSMKDLSDEEDSWEGSDDNQQNAAGVNNKRKASKREENADPNIIPATRKRQKSAAARADLHDFSLLEIIIKHSNSIDNAVKEWVARYRSDRATAAAELMTLLVKVSGCDAELSSEDIEAGEVDQLAARLTNTVVQEGGVDVLHNHRTGRSFIEHYKLFWDKVLRQLASADLLFDDFELNDKLCRMVTALSISVVRSFRYAATLTAAQLISSWISISAGLTESRELAKYQLDAEEKKKKPSREAVAALRRTVDRCHSRVEDLRNFRSVTFTGVFSHRFRDVSDEIRAVVIESIGSWVLALPMEFLADTYLKYLAWALSDKSPLVRGKALAALEGLYRDSDNIPRLQDFTNRFTGRFIELMYDVDEGVAAAGLQVLALLVEQQVIEEKDVSGVYSMLTLPNASLRHAAAGLVVQLLPGQGREVLEAAQEQLQADAAASTAVGGSQQAGKSGKGGRSRGSKGQAAAAAVANDPVAVQLEAAAAILADDKKLKLAGFLAVMARLALNEPAGGDLAAAERRASILPSQGLSATATLSGATLPTLQASVVWNLVDAVWDQAADVIGDIGSLVDELADDGAVELMGKLGSAHLAAVLAAAVKRSIQGAGLINARKGRFGRPRMTAAANSSINEDAQQEATVVLMQKLPALLTKFQSEPHVVAPLLAIPRLLRLELYSLGGQVDAYRALLQQVEGLLQRHNLHELLTEAAATLAHASKEGPAVLQEVGMQVLHTCSTTSANKLASAASAVTRLTSTELAEGVSDLMENPVDAPDALLSLLTSLRRCQALMAAGANELAKDKQLGAACQTLLQQSLEGRELGAEITSLLLQVTNMSLLWQQVAVTADPTNLNSYIQSRNSFVRVLEALMDSMGSEQLIPPQQLLKGAFQGLGGVSQGDLGGQDAVTFVTDQLSAGIPTLQDQAAQLLMDLIFVGGGLVAVLQGDGNAAGSLDQVAPSRRSLERCWRYCLSVLDREGPDLEALEADDEADDEQSADDDPEGWDAEDAATHRARRRAAKREALSAAAANLSKLKMSAVVALSKLCLYKTMPEPHLSWMLSRLVTLLDGRGPQISGLIRALLQNMKSSNPDGLPSICISALTDLYELAQDAGHEDDDDDDVDWQLMAGVAAKIAGLYVGHNLSQGPLHSLISRGVSWVFESPGSRAAFLTTCLAPFTAKLAPQEAEKVAGEVKELVAGSDMQSMIAGDRATADIIATYIKSLQDRAAGKKPTRGVLKTPARAAAAEPEDEIEDDDGPPTAVAGGSRKHPRGSRIKFAADVDVSPEDQQRAAAAAGQGSGGGAARGGTSRQQQQQRGSSSRGKRQRGGDDEDDGWDSDDGQQQQQSDSSSGWHSKRSGGKEKPQQRGKRRRQQQQQQQQQKEEPLEQFIDEEDAEVQQQQHKSPAGAGRTRGRQQQSPFAAAAAAAPKQHSARTALRMFAGEAGPLETQMQSQSQSQQHAAGRAAARRGRLAAAVAAAAQDLRAGSETDVELQQQQHCDIAISSGGIADAADLDLAAATDDEADLNINPDWRRQQQQQQQDYEQSADDQGAADDDGSDAQLDGEAAATGGNSMGLGHNPAESEDVHQEGAAGGSDHDDDAGDEDHDEDRDDGQDSDAEGGALSQYSEPLSNVEVILDEITDLGEVDEPPPQQRRGRRRR